MKKIFLLATSALLLLAGCAKEVSGPNGEGGLQQVTFTATMDNGTVTRAAVDGDGAAASVNRCIMEIYYDGSLFERKIQPVTHGDKITATFTTQMVANRTYTVAFWADHVTAAASTPTTDELAQDLYYTTKTDTDNKGLQAIAFKGTYAGNIDARDAFFHSKEYTIAQAGSAFEATLYRPFAQVNVITTDWDKADKVSNLKPTSVDVTIKNPLTAFNALTGVASTTVSSLTYNAGIYTSPTSGTDATLSMDYLFASTDKAVIDIDWEAGQGTAASTVSHSFANIPYQRNYRTNIKGNLLTSQGQWTVTVDPVWKSESEGEHNYNLVADIAGANTAIASQIAAGEEVINIKFSQEPNDAGVPGTQSGELVSKAIVTTDLPEDTQLNILVESETKALYVGDYESETDATLATRDKEDAVVNITATATITSLVINAPSKTVYLNGEEVSSVGTITSVDATTSQNTLIVKKNQTITSLTVHQGGLEIHGTVGALEITETDHDNNPVKVRTSENLSQSVFDVIYKAGKHDFIDRPMYVEKANATDPVTYDIVLADPVAQIGETKYYTLASAFAAATAGQTIELLKNCSVASSITVEKSVTLDLNNYTLTCCVASGRPLLVKSDVEFTVKDGVFVDGTNDASFGAIDTRISGVAQSNVTINVSNVDFGVFDSDGNCTAPFKTNNGAIIKFRSTGACSLSDVRAASDHYILDNGGAVNTAVSGGKYIVNHNNSCSDSGCTNLVCAFILPGGTSTMENVIVSTTNCVACVSGNVDLTNCTMTGDNYAVVTSGMETVNIESGSYTGGVDAVRVQTSGGTVNINGGSFTGTTTALFANVNTSQYPSAVATINVYGGQINGDMTTSSSPCSINLYGGIYSEEPSTTDAKVGFGYAQATNDDPQTSTTYPWKVAANPAEDAEVSVAKTGTTTIYGTLADFRDAVNAGNYDNFYGYTVTLLKDVTYSPTDYWVPIGYLNGGSWVPFCGTFNGNGHKVEGLNIDTYELDPTNNKYWPGGFFGSTYAATISNLTVCGQTDCAGMVGYAWYTDISDCVSYMNSDLCYNISGGFVAHAQDHVTLTNCKNYGNFVCMTSADYAEVGGIVGRFYGGDHCSVTNCENHGNISWKGENGGGAQRCLGGIVACFYNASAISNPQKCVISGCKNYGVIYNKNATSGTTTTTLGGIGGIVGKPFLQAYGIGITISNCVNEGSVISSGRAGGIIGTLNEAWQNIGKFTTVSGCTNSGTVYGTDGSRGQIYGVMFTNTSDPDKDNILSGNQENGVLKAYEDYNE